jgi:hypothetical protein
MTGFIYPQPDKAIGNPEDTPATNPDQPSSQIALLKAILIELRTTVGLAAAADFSALDKRFAALEERIAALEARL